MLLEKLAADLGVAFGHRAALAALRESEERFRLLLDSSPRPSSASTLRVSARS